MTTISRKAWGARAPRGGPGPLTTSRVEGVALHWPAMTRPVRGVSNVAASLRAWQAFHMDRNGWSDIAYQEAIDQDGNVYVLRGLATQSGANGDTDVNERFGAILLVLAPGEQPTEAMKAATRGRIAAHRDLFPRSTRVVGHGQIRPGGTQCPGPIVQGLINRGDLEPGKGPTAPARDTRGEQVDRAVKALRKAPKPDGPRGDKIRGALKTLRSIKPWKKA